LGDRCGHAFSSDRRRIQYADKQSSISNAYKKWIGELRGLKELRTLEKKREESGIRGWRMKRKTDLEPCCLELETCMSYVPTPRHATFSWKWCTTVRRSSLRRWVPRRLGRGQEGCFEGQSEGSGVKDRRDALIGYFKDYDVEVDKGVFKALLPIYRANVPASLQPAILKEIDTKFKGNADAWVDDLIRT
jgi:hypothetical protein